MCQESRDLNVTIEKIPTVFDGMCMGVTFEGKYKYDTVIILRMGNKLSYNVYFIDKDARPLMTFNSFPIQPPSIKLKSYGIARLQ